MRYQHIIKDERGKIRIEVHLWSDSIMKDRSGNHFRWNVMVFQTPPGKRNELHLYQFKSIVTDEEIKKAMLGAWERIKPV